MTSLRCGFPTSLSACLFQSVQKLVFSLTFSWAPTEKAPSGLSEEDSRDEMGSLAGHTILRGLVSVNCFHTTAESANPHSMLTLYSLHSLKYSPILLSLALKYSDVHPFATADLTDMKAACSAELRRPCTTEKQRRAGIGADDHCSR